MTRYFADDDAVARVGRGLVDRSLPKAEWTHAAHFAACLWLLRHAPEPPVPVAMPDMIRTYNLATGGENTDSAGYHETITQASIAAASGFLGRYLADHPLHAVVDDLMASPLGKPDWLLVHWSRERLFSVEARRKWVEPDLSPLAVPA